MPSSFLLYLFFILFFNSAWIVNADGAVLHDVNEGVSKSTLDFFPVIQYGFSDNATEIKLGVGSWSKSDGSHDGHHDLFYISMFDFDDSDKKHSFFEIGRYVDLFRELRNSSDPNIISSGGVFLYGVDSDSSPDRYGIGLRFGLGGAFEDLKTKIYTEFTLLPEFLSTNWSGSFFEYEIRFGAKHRITKFIDVDLSYRYGAGGSTIYKTTMLSARLSF